MRLITNSVQKILSGQAVQVPVYDFKTHSRVVGEVVVIQVEAAMVVVMMMVTTDHCAQAGHEVVVVEGILVFYFTRIRRMFDLKLFVDTDPDTRLARLL